jgi:hypothetical protein
MLIQTERTEPLVRRLRRRVLLHLTLFPVIQFSGILMFICIAMIHRLIR